MAIIKETPVYTEYKNSKKNCSFKIKGKLQNGRIISKFMGWYLIGYYDDDTADCNYKETAIEIKKVKIK